MDSLRDSVEAAEAGEAYAYMYPFVFFEQYKIIVREASTTTTACHNNSGPQQQ